MRGKVKRVMDFIHSVAYMELQGSEYVEFLESIEYDAGPRAGGGQLAGFGRGRVTSNEQQITKSNKRQ